ncbi:uncharacterized protein GIQ15_00255 [Arthroderma uncinatum]|uniref:uncharacterized protein n=1 Tax=Arthroderma uncinatum TaxID=74035 RepID=UPI00144AD8B1|nr:uncharacterized protein GIQ15_00255 [Arthroderma uncinatum]KAF3490738.1 hypothetical protein GIQ15_00255 [Arthroderma uncinatum]
MDTSSAEVACSLDTKDESGLAYMSPSLTATSEASLCGKPAPNGRGPQKPKQSKSRNGCVTCKSKRLKCDETKPTCHQCQKRNVVCGGYKKDFKWRSFEESSFTGKPKPKVKKHDTGALGDPCKQPPATKSASGPFINVNAQNIPRKLSRSMNGPSPAGRSDSSFELRVAPLLESLDIRGDDTKHSIATCGPSDPFLSITSTLTKGALPDIGGPCTLDLISETQAIKSRSISPQSSSEGNDIEEIIREDDFGEATGLKRKRQSPSVSDSREPGISIPGQIDFHVDSAEMLLTRFDRRTCGILSVKDGMTENPWRTAVGPLVRESPALFHAVCALAAFHSTKENPIYKYLGMDHMRQSIRTLAVDIESMRTDAALATTLALAFADTWDRHVSTGVQHLRGAKVLFNRAVVEQRHNPISQRDQSRLTFLYNSWMYIAVIAQLTSPEDTGFDEIPFPPSFTPRVHDVDPLMGCAATLFPLIGRVAGLVQKVRKTTTNSFAIISQAIELKTLVEQWTPPRYFNPPEDPTSDVQHSFQTAQAYRWATLLHLHQAVPEIPSESASEIAKRVLVLLATVPLGSRTIVVQIFPLLAASCEVDSEEDRKWVRERWAAMQQRLAIGNVDRCFEVVYEVWRRRDAHSAGMPDNQLDPYIVPFDTSGMGNCSRHDSVMEPLIFGENPVHGGQDSYDIINGDDTRILTTMPLIESFPPISSPTPTMPSHFPSRNGSADLGVNGIEYSKTARGKSHWLSVMNDWRWEGISNSISYLPPNLAHW